MKLMRGDMGKLTPLPFFRSSSKESCGSYLYTRYRWCCDGRLLYTSHRQIEGPVSSIDSPWIILRSYQPIFHSINLITVCPLTENMPGPSATKPGDM